MKAFLVAEHTPELEGSVGTHRLRVCGIPVP